MHFFREYRYLTPTDINIQILYQNFYYILFLENTKPFSRYVGSFVLDKCLEKKRISTSKFLKPMKFQSTAMFNTIIRFGKMFSFKISLQKI